MESILTKQLSFKIGAKTILDNISLQVPEKGIYGYLGRNGAGNRQQSSYF